jgi:hypothetical protein
MQHHEEWGGGEGRVWGPPSWWTISVTCGCGTMQLGGRGHWRLGLEVVHKRWPRASSWSTSALSTPVGAWGRPRAWRCQEVDEGEGLHGRQWWGGGLHEWRWHSTRRHSWSPRTMVAQHTEARSESTDDGDEVEVSMDDDDATRRGTVGVHRRRRRRGGRLKVKFW